MIDKFIKTWAKILKESNDNEVSDKRYEKNGYVYDEEDRSYSLKELSELIKSGKFVSFDKSGSDSSSQWKKLEEIFSEYILVEIISEKDFRDSKGYVSSKLYEILNGDSFDSYDPDFQSMFDVYQPSPDPEDVDIILTDDGEQFFKELEKNFLFIKKSDLSNLDLNKVDNDVSNKRAFFYSTSDYYRVEEYEGVDISTEFEFILNRGQKFYTVLFNKDASSDLTKFVYNLGSKNHSIKNEFFGYELKGKVLNIIWEYFPDSIKEKIEDKFGRSFPINF
jgi:hypothetical protein